MRRTLHAEGRWHHTIGLSIYLKLATPVKSALPDVFVYWVDQLRCNKARKLGG
jgi:hypothetical protein